jgi:predicted amidophosphoribosyltransferase
MRKYTEFYWNKCADGVYRPVGICSVCGKEYKSDNIGASSYCPECAARIKKEKTAERVRRFREKARQK